MFSFLHHDKYNLKRWRTDQVLALSFGFATALTIIAGSTLVSVASGSKALSLLESIFPTTRFLASSVMTASATILALMVTLLSFAGQGEKELNDVTLQRVRQNCTVWHNLLCNGSYFPEPAQFAIVKH
jgi:hypothetical protein